LDGGLEQRILGLKGGVSDLDLRLQLRILHFGLQQLLPHHSHLLHPLNGRSLRFNVRSRL